MSHPSRALLGPLTCLLATSMASPAEADEISVRGDACAAVSANFSVRSHDPGHPADKVAAECERQRSRLQRQWLGCTGPRWSGRCDVIIYANEFAYLRHVGSQAVMTQGVSEIRRQHNRIVSRRIDLVADPHSHTLTALAHELTHLVVADRFPACRPPRWADEGIALLADDAEKQTLHLRDLRRALASRSCPSVREMLATHRYPQGSRRLTFYGQSLSMVGYLSELDHPAKVVEMVALAMERGYDTALREIYGIADLNELQRRWRDHLDGSPQLVAHTP